MAFGVGHARVGAQEGEVLAADHSVETCHNGIVHIEMLTGQFDVVHHVLSATLTGLRRSQWLKWYKHVRAA